MTLLPRLLQDTATPALYLPFGVPLLLVVLTIATVVDLRTRRVPLWLTLGTLLTGLSAATAVGGWSGLAAGLVGAAVGGAVLFLFVLRGGLGGADVLLLAGIGAWAGWEGALHTAWWAALAGALLALFALLRRERSFPYVPALTVGAILAVFAPWPIG